MKLVNRQMYDMCYLMLKVTCNGSKSNPEKNESMPENSNNARTSAAAVNLNTMSWLTQASERFSFALLEEAGGVTTPEPIVRLIREVFWLLRARFPQQPIKDLLKVRIFVITKSLHAFEATSLSALFIAFSSSGQISFTGSYTKQF